MRCWSIVAPAAYVLAVLVLFQFVVVQIAIGSSTEATSDPDRNQLIAVPKQPSTKGATGLPVRIKIPRIGVNAVIQPVGLTSDGSMGVPKLPMDTAWYMLGPKPGEKGSAVISGHVNWWNGARGVFQRLNALKVGDRITVLDDRGASSTFVVRKTRIYGLMDDATIVFRSNDGKSHLNLVTCSGIWDRVLQMYSKRLVVFADKVE